MKVHINNYQGNQHMISVQIWRTYLEMLITKTSAKKPIRFISKPVS